MANTELQKTFYGQYKELLNALYGQYKELLNAFYDQYKELQKAFYGQYKELLNALYGQHKELLNVTLTRRPVTNCYSPTLKQHKFRISTQSQESDLSAFPRFHRTVTL